MRQQGFLMRKISLAMFRSLKMLQILLSLPLHSTPQLLALFFLEAIASVQKNSCVPLMCAPQFRAASLTSSSGLKIQGVKSVRLELGTFNSTLLINTFSL